MKSLLTIAALSLLEELGQAIKAGDDSKKEDIMETIRYNDSGISRVIPDILRNHLSETSSEQLEGILFVLNDAKDQIAKRNTEA